MTEKEFTSLVPELRQTALHVCRGCGTDGMTAEDVAQDTMLRLWAIRKDITSAQHAKGLTGCVAKHFCIDRHRKKREVSLLLHPHLQAESHEPPPDMMMETQENDMWLQQKLLELPSTQYRVLHLRQVEKEKHGRDCRYHRYHSCFGCYDPVESPTKDADGNQKKNGDFEEMREVKH